MNVKIVNKIEITINGQVITLSKEDAKQMIRQLQEAVGGEQPPIDAKAPFHAYPPQWSSPYTLTYEVLNRSDERLVKDKQYQGE